MTLKRIFLVTIFIILTVQVSFAQGVLVSNPGSSQSSGPSTKVQELIGEYIQSVVLQNLIQTSGELIGRLGQQGQIRLLPSYAYLAAHQTVAQLFKQEQTQELLRDTYSEVFDAALDKLDEGVAPSEIQQTIKSLVENKLGDISEHYVYRHIMQEVLKLVYQEQTRFVAQRVMGARAQAMAAQQMAIRQGVQRAYAQLAAQAQQQAIQQAARQQYAQQYAAQQYAVKQQAYEAAFGQYQQALQQQYQQSLQNSLSR